MARVTGAPFEDYVWRGFWAREFPPSSGWTSEFQKPLLGGSLRPDFAAWKDGMRAMGDAKDKAVITLADLDKVIEDAGVFRATYCYLIHAGDSHLPERVLEYAEHNAVTLIRTNWRVPYGCWGN